MNIFDILSLCDWITPVVKLAEDVAHGGPVNMNAWTFFIPRDAAVKKGWSPSHIEKLLKQHGVEYWSSLTNFGVFSFSVHGRDAGRVEELLNRNEIPIHPRSQGA